MPRLLAAPRPSCRGGFPLGRGFSEKDLAVHPREQLHARLDGEGLGQVLPAEPGSGELKMPRTLAAVSGRMGDSRVLTLRMARARVFRTAARRGSFSFSLARFQGWASTI